MMQYCHHADCRRVTGPASAPISTIGSNMVKFTRWVHLFDFSPLCVLKAHVKTLFSHVLQHGEVHQVGNQTIPSPHSTFPKHNSRSNNLKASIPCQVNLRSEQLDVQHELSPPRKSKVHEKAFSGWSLFPSGIDIFRYFHQSVFSYIPYTFPYIRMKYLSGGNGESRGV